MSCTTGTWTGTPAPILTYQWYSGTFLINGANQNTYRTLPGEVGQSFTCRVTGTNDEGSAVGVSNAIVVTAPLAAPICTIFPNVTGNEVVGNVLASTTGSWTGNPAPTFTYQWKSGATNVGTGVNTYTTVAGDVGLAVTCVVTGTNSQGSGNGISNAITVRP